MISFFVHIIHHHHYYFFTPPPGGGHSASSSILHRTRFFATVFPLSHSQPTPPSSCSMDRRHSFLGRPLYSLSKFIGSWAPCGVWPRGFIVVLRGTPCSNLILVISNTDFGFCSMFGFYGVRLLTLTPNPQPGGPGDHSLSCLYPLTC